MKALISEELVFMDIDATNSEEVINILADAMYKDGRLESKVGFMEDVLDREHAASTAIGFLVATPHSKSSNVKEAIMSFGRLNNPVQWDEDERVKYVFLIGVPLSGQGDKHLEILGALFRRIYHEEFREALETVTTAKDFIKLLGM